MKRKIIILSVFLAATIAGITISHKAMAKGQTLLIHACVNKDDQGNITSLGNTCDPGESSCTSNPCPQ